MKQLSVVVGPFIAVYLTERCFVFEWFLNSTVFNYFLRSSTVNYNLNPIYFVPEIVDCTLVLWGT